MFCDGQCTNKKKRCGLYAELITQVPGKEVKKMNRCILFAQFDLQKQLLDSVNRLHAAMNSTRNTEASVGKEIVSTVGTGLLGMIHMLSATGETEAARKVQRLGEMTLGAMEAQRQQTLPEGEKKSE